MGTAKHSFLIFSLFTMMACQQKTEDGAAKSLDQLENGSGAALSNVCRPPQALLSEKVLKDRLDLLEKERINLKDAGLNTQSEKDVKQAIKDGFAAIPPEVQARFLELGGTIVVRPNLLSLCKGNDKFKAYAGERAISACYRYELPISRELVDEVKSGEKKDFSDIKKQGGQKLTIYLDPKVSRIHDGLVRGFGLVTAEVLNNLDAVTMPNKSKRYLWRADSQKIRPKLDNMVAAFLQDLKARQSKSVGQFAKYEAKGEATRAERDAFGSWLYAETFDSLFCNVNEGDAHNTSKLAYTNYSRTVKAFMAVGQDGLALGFFDTVNGYAMSAYNSVSSAAGAAYDATAQAAGSAYNTAAGAAGSAYQTASDTYANTYNSIYNRTNNVYNQVVDGNGGQSPSWLQTASILANGAAPEISQVPRIGGYMEAAQGAITAGMGGNINGDGYYQDATAAERVDGVYSVNELGKR